MQTHTTLDDSAQFTDRSVHRYEVIFGEDFVSTGGLESTTEICASLGLSPGIRVLDVGCGIGGSAFHMAGNYGAHVTGVDLLHQLIEQGQHRAAQRGIQNVRFIANNIIDAELPEEGFDLIYSRDAIMYNEDKAAVFQRLRSLLAPGGRLFISDYGRGPDPLAPDFTDYVAETGYYLLQADEYAAALEEAGFTQARVDDKTPEFIDILQREMDKLAQVCAGPTPALEQEDQDYLNERWRHKIDWCQHGNMRWLHARANA